ncbi:MAG TPA: DEAD/DEAH box helicase family protein [Polyangiaceae bacterium]|nr:DEAD/DEAH box helicase family protein [Polyangiaceae bacterium]
MSTAPRPTLRFDGGTIELRDLPASVSVPDFLRRDERAASLRARGSAYADVVRWLVREKIEFDDRARAYQELTASPRVHREPRPYQREALDAWSKARGRGVVVLPTGAGKTHVAVMAIEQKRRSALVVAPTLDLVRQWYDLLVATFGDSCAVGIVGGGHYEVQPLTVTTYDSAHLYMERFGARFGLVVFDECHHLPSEAYALAARACIAPYRLGLTATPERNDGREPLLDELVGPIVCRRDIVELAGTWLAEYETERIEVELSPSERQEYEEQRGVYLSFLRRHGVRMGDPRGWSEFVMLSSRSAEGREAMAAYRRQRELAFTAPAKMAYLELLLTEHAGDRAIVFSQENATAYAVSRTFLLPCITHQTKIKERSAILRGLSDGTYNAIVTSKVLNEGVDVPDANVAVVVSGSGSVREHVQRLGRVLRKREGKRAVLYELVTRATVETNTSDRRREHSAYRS